MSTEILQRFLETIKDKWVFIATHWDADGVSSGAMLYHLVKRFANITGTLSKGIVFKVDSSDIFSDYDYIIVSDIIPGNLDPNKVIYIDHHPHEKDYALKIHDDKKQSCSLLIWEKLIYPAILEKVIPIDEIKYFVFLTLLGYFGDGGKEDDLPVELYIIAKEVLPDLMKWNNFGNRYALEIERYVPLLNVGKRAFWDGNLPLQMLITTTSVEEIIYNIHPLAQELNKVRSEMRYKYNKEVELMEFKNLHVGIIECESNIQGVLCARLMQSKPILIINLYQDYAIGSMRVPDNIDFDAGAFLKQLSERLEILEGGGHEKAAGITFWKKDLEKFLEALKELDEQIILQLKRNDEEK